MLLLGIDVTTQDPVDSGLITLSLGLEEIQDLRIETQGDLLFLCWPHNRLFKKGSVEFR